MSPLNATKFETPTDGGPDIEMYTNRGFPGASLINRNDRYFWYHHSKDDRLVVEHKDSLDRCAALWAAASYVIADLSMDIPKTLI